jgi:hypothetical protein
VSRGRHKQAIATGRVSGVARIAVPVALISAAPVGAVITYTDHPVETATTLIADPPPPTNATVDRAASPSRSLSERRSPLPSETPAVEITGEEPAGDAAETEDESAEPTPEPTVSAHMFATAGLNVRDAASTDASVITVVAQATELALTGVTDGAWVQVLVDDTLAWVHGDYLSEDEPPADAGISYEPCSYGSEIESGLTPDAIRVYRAVCARFPSVTSYGGYRSGGGAHSEGRAVDIVIPNSDTGDAIAAWVRENYQKLGVSEVIWSQQIWSVTRSSEGWRWMEDRGSTTANHYDHVHVTVYGDSGG